MVVSPKEQQNSWPQEMHDGQKLHRNKQGLQLNIVELFRRENRRILKNDSRGQLFS